MTLNLFMIAATAAFSRLILRLVIAVGCRLVCGQQQFSPPVEAVLEGKRECGNCGCLGSASYCCIPHGVIVSCCCSPHGIIILLLPASQYWGADCNCQHTDYIMNQLFLAVAANCCSLHSIRVGTATTALTCSTLIGRKINRQKTAVAANPK